jgi:hypothetical protein
VFKKKKVEEEEKTPGCPVDPQFKNDTVST